LIPAGAFAGPRGELDMWHPTGAPRNRLAIGDYAGASGDDGGGPIDLAIVAPSPIEARSDWLEPNIALAARRLSDAGVLWIIVPRRWRRTAERALGRAGLTPLEAVLAFPPWPRAAHLVPLAPAALRDAGPRHLGLPRAAAWILGSLVGVGALRRPLRRIAPSCALVAARQPGLALWRWLGELDGSGVATATVSLGPRRDARVAVAMRFGAHGRAPDLVVKVALEQAGVERVLAERRALELLGPAAARAGAAVPIPKPCPYPWMLACDPLAGRSAAAVLASAPRRLLPVARELADWLARWNAATASRTLASAEMLDELVHGPVGRLAGDGSTSEAYVRALAALAARLQGQAVVVVAGHGDLTMANVLTGGPTLSILDWESAIAGGLPLADLWYALADAVARAGRVPHASAVEALVTGARPAPPALARLPAQHAAALGLSADEAALAFHACWLGHAEDELRRGDGERRFADVVRTVATRRLLWPQNG
jgi:hypothetical protein